jgi:hypothetical protein
VGEPHTGPVDLADDDEVGPRPGRQPVISLLTGSCSLIERFSFADDHVPLTPVDVASPHHQASIAAGR